MKKKRKPEKGVIAAALFLVLVLAGFLIVEAESYKLHTDPHAHPLNAPAEAYHAVIEVVEVMDESSTRIESDTEYRLTKSILHFCSRRFGRYGGVLRIYLPEEMALASAPSQMYLVELFIDPTEYKYVRYSHGDDPKPVAIPFVDGKLVYEEDPTGTFENIDRINNYLESENSKRDKLAELLPSGPIGTGSTVEEVIEFFEDFVAYYATMQGYDLEEFLN